MSSLLSLLDKIDWKLLPQGNRKGGGRDAKMSTNSMTVQFYRNKKKFPHSLSAQEVRIRMGKDIIEKLQIRNKDSMAVFLDPDNFMIMMITQVTTPGAGFRLYEEKGGRAFRFHFRWQGAIPLDEMPPTEVEYEISNKRLIFKVVDKRSNLEHSFGR